MKTILAIGPCLKRKKEGDCFYHLFHFKGYYLGLKISQIKVLGHNCEIFYKGEVYLLSLKVIKIDQETLITQLLSFKKLMELAN